jgi:hypothetical protein
MIHVTGTKRGCSGKPPSSLCREKQVTTRRAHAGTATVFKGRRSATSPNAAATQRQLEGVVMTLEQACPSEYQGAQCAFKDSMIH